MTETERQAVLAQRRSRANDGPLRALFLGRFDRQKGLDRLVQIIERLRADGVPVVWRVVGTAIVDGCEADLRRLAELVTIERPVYRPQERTALYEWADIIVLPSRYEGLPLTILEAQRCGVVPIAPRSGAIEEAITHEITGILFDQEHCVERISQSIEKLHKNRQELDRLSMNAAKNTKSLNFSTQPLATMLYSMLQNKTTTIKTRAIQHQQAANFH